MTSDEQKCLAAFVAAGHKPKLNAKGEPDTSALDIDDPEGFGGHNGFACSNPGCWETVCIWCWGPDYEIDRCEIV